MANETWAKLQRDKHWRPLSTDLASGVREAMRYDPHTGDWELYQEQVVDPIMEVTKAEFAASTPRDRWGKPMNLAARIPLWLIWDLRRTRGVDLFRDKKELKRFMNDRDNNVWRVRDGHV